MKNQHKYYAFILSLSLPLVFTKPAISQPAPASPSVSYSKNQMTIGGARADIFSISNWNKNANSKLIADAVDADRIKGDRSDAKDSTFDAQLDPQRELLAKVIYLYFDNIGLGFTNLQFRPLAEMLLDKQGYAIDRVFDNASFQAIGLSSKDVSKPPVLVFLGTNDIGDATITNRDPKGVGLSQFFANKKAIQSWLVTITNNQQLNPKGFKPDVTGQSLGGALTQWTASEFPTFISSAVSFQSPGITRNAAHKFIENGGDPNQVRHYIVDGDYRSLFGEVFIPGKVVVSTFDVSEADRKGYFDRKHLSGILADLSSLIPESSDPLLNQPLSQTSKPANQTLSEISVDELNQPDFTFQGKDWQIGLERVRANDPNFVVDRKHVEELRSMEVFGKIIN